MQLSLSIYLPAAKSGQVHFSKSAALLQAQSGQNLHSLLVTMKQKTLPANKTTDTDSETHYPLEALHFSFSASIIPHGSQICELLFWTTFSGWTLWSRGRALAALKALGRAWMWPWSCPAQAMPEGHWVYRAVSDSWPCSSPPAAVCRNADGNVCQAGTLQTLTQGAGSTNPQTNSYQLRKSEQRGCCHSFGPTTTAVPGTSAPFHP